jgi:hypothetical protein
VIPQRQGDVFLGGHVVDEPVTPLKIAELLAIGVPLEIVVTLDRAPLEEDIAFE